MTEETPREHIIIGGSLYAPTSSVTRDGDGNIAPQPEVDDNTGLAFVTYDENASAGSDLDHYEKTRKLNPAITTKSVDGFKGVLSTPESWRNNYGMSLDGIYIPYTTFFQTDSAKGRDPTYDSPTFEAPYTFVKSDGKFQQKAPYGTTAKTATSANLNPFARGHNIAYLIKGATETDLDVDKSGYDTNIPDLGNISTAEQRPVGLRGPMVLSGWGYDTDGLPVPNALLDATNINTNPKDPNYGKPIDASQNYPTDKDSFIPSHMSAIGDWKSGPIDLRWDRDRKVWVGGKFNGVYLSKAVKCIFPTAGADGKNSFNFGVSGNINIGGRLYRNPCSQEACSWDSYFPQSSLYPDIEIYDPEDRDWCGLCHVDTFGNVICDDLSQACLPFYDALIIRSVEHVIGQENSYTNCGDKFLKSGPDPNKRRLGNPCHGWGGSYTGKLENVNEKIADDGTFTNRAKSILYEKIFIENPLSQGLMAGDSFFSYDTGRRISYSYAKSSIPTCNTAGNVTGTPEPTIVTEDIPIHIIIQAEFFGVEVITRSGCEGGEVTACSRKFFAQGFSTMEDCGPDSDYPSTGI